jgi:membrane-associated phospholipid phosphatase
MLPLFGKVKTWLFDSMTMVTSIRPSPPPSTNSDKFKKETEEILAFSKNATREQLRIVHFWADGVATYTPPGHWNAIAADDFITQNFSEVRWARNMALLNMSLMDAAIACWDAKFFYFNPRPSQVNPDIKTTTGLPNFPSFTSGHSTFSGAAATILGHIIPSNRTAYEAMAMEASLSRMYGAIHYRSDCEEGLKCGNVVGGYAIARATTDGAE